ncbi:hypothetical protein SPRG_10101 [Saprolegnia parasitica CBS 223.65]|uniref:Uncharacterized protein n=1 Tax=Saprolegnia parasitica (strain CBS 223.65) TaxID=695850 RepID=A0A067CDE3_SAPPC|nr:hypothetical protein SPRG_10101 [Saprolegnia parasitica CBS 223.65]KDO24571.1 hypothetical protein SPRG_10101 [Saprolegnia parasitica CBS 223.65]|eukprot:XP_012204640.1 hypothetical protein SPRG_10101 [Saprolegnia parasitica CBS 223.65]
MLSKRLSLNILSPKAALGAAPLSPKATSPRGKDRLRLTKTPLPSDENQRSPPVTPDATDDVIHEIQATLTSLLQRMDTIKPAKLRSIKLGGELRGLLGKADDEFGAHEGTFRKHVHNDGLQIQLQNFVASLHGLSPVLDSIQKTTFLVNAFVKRNVEFAFQEISSYYASIFTELSLAVAHASGSAAEAAVLAALRAKPTEPPTSDDATAPEVQYQTGQQFYFGHGRATNHHQAFVHYKLAAAQGHMEAMVCLAQMYRDGRVVESDHEAATQWCTRAASLGSVEATFALGDLLVCAGRSLQAHKSGLRCKRRVFLPTWRDAKRRMHWRWCDSRKLPTKAIETHSTLPVPHATSQVARFTVNLGHLYEIGAVGAVQWQLAKEAYLKASDQGHSKAQEALGRLYYYGHGVEMDKTQAGHYFQLATQSDPSLPDAWYLLGLMYANGDEVPADQPRAKRCFIKAAMLQHIDAPIELAAMLLTSEKAPVSDEVATEALKWLVFVEPPTARAQYLLGTLFEHNAFLNVPSALRYYTAAARAGHGVAAQRAAQLYYSGQKGADVRSEKRLAFEMYLIAARTSHDAESMNALGLMYEDGEGVAVDMTMAADCFRQAADRQSAHGHFNYACLLRAGRGVEKDVDAAKHHFEQALALGYAQARQFLSTTK